MKLIIAAADGSAGAERAVAVAAELAASRKAKLLIVNISEDNLSNAELRLIERLRVTEGDALEEISRRILSKAAAIASDHGAANVATKSGCGDPTKVILDTVKNEHADAIVVGRRGRGQLEGLLLGSVSQKIAILARCIVIIVP